MKRTLFTCRCGSLEHMFVVSADEEDAFIEVHLAPAPWHKRIVRALKYIFGHRSRYGNFEEILLDPATAVVLADQLLDWAQGDTNAFHPNDVY